MSYKFSEHNTGTRDTFSKKGADFTAMQVCGYYKVSLSDNEEELSYKVFGGTHSDGVAKQGQCYSFGAEQVGEPRLRPGRRSPRPAPRRRTRCRTRLRRRGCQPPRRLRAYRFRPCPQGTP